MLVKIKWILQYVCFYGALKAVNVLLFVQVGHLIYPTLWSKLEDIFFNIRWGLGECACKTIFQCFVGLCFKIVSSNIFSFNWLIVWLKISFFRVLYCVNGLLLIRWWWDVSHNCKGQTPDGTRGKVWGFSTSAELILKGKHGFMEIHGTVVETFESGWLQSLHVQVIMKLHIMHWTKTQRHSLKYHIVSVIILKWSSLEE